MTPLIPLGRKAQQTWDEIKQYFLGQEDISEHDVLQLYARAHTVYNCANTRAENVARVPMRAIDAEGKPIDHEVNAVFADTSNYYKVAHDSEIALFFTGTNLLLPQSNFMRQFLPTAENLRWINPAVWSRDENSIEGLRGFRIHTVGAGRQQQPVGYIPADYALYMHEFDFRNDFDGVAPAEVAYFAAAGQHEKWLTVYSWFVNRAIPASILQDAPDATAPMSTTIDAPKKLRELLTEMFKGSRDSGKTLVSPYRLEHIQIQQDMDKMALPELSAEQRKAIHDAAQVPEILANFNAATYDNADQAVQFWLRFWLQPRCMWYARQYSKFFSDWYGETLRIGPDFSAILEGEDNTDRINAQVTAGYMDLFTAQTETGLEPDQELKGIYLIPGFGPMSIAAIRQQATSTSTNPPPLSNGFSVSNGNPPLLPAASAQVPDAIYSEIKVAARKGINFVPDALPEPTALYIAALVELALDREVIVTAAKSHYRGVQAAKAIQATRLNFENTFGDILSSARSEDIDRRRFGSLLRSELARFIRLAYLDGLEDGGVPGEDLTAEDETAIKTLIDEQSAYISSIGGTLFKGDGISDAQADLKPTQWFNGSVYPAYVKGLQSAAGNMMVKWVLGATEEHCPSCLILNNQVHRLKNFVDNGFFPKSSKLVCGPGHLCDCAFVPSPGERATGRLSSVPIGALL